MRKIRSNPAMRLINQYMSSRARRSDRRVMGMNLLVLHTVGRKSGRPRQSPVAWFPDGDDRWLIAASAAGADADPDWYHNMKAHPDQVSIELSGRGLLPVTATELTGTEYARAWHKLVTAAPRFKGYQDKTARIIPVIRLIPRPRMSVW
jgi:deazaflavin-dependent oxidoreductase (nitroreductase family)